MNWVRFSSGAGLHQKFQEPGPHSKLTTRLHLRRDSVGPDPVRWLSAPTLASRKQQSKERITPCPYATLFFPLALYASLQTPAVKKFIDTVKQRREVTFVRHDCSSKYWKAVSQKQEVSMPGAVVTFNLQLDDTYSGIQEKLAAALNTRNASKLRIWQGYALDAAGSAAGRVRASVPMPFMARSFRFLRPIPDCVVTDQWPFRISPFQCPFQS